MQSLVQFFNGAWATTLIQFPLGLRFHRLLTITMEVVANLRRSVNVQVRYLAPAIDAGIAKLGL
eukprot:635758-Pyramimonas_sp.AAC.1